MAEDIDSLEGFRKLFFLKKGERYIQLIQNDLKGNIYYPRCGDKRVFSVDILYWNDFLLQNTVDVQLHSYMQRKNASYQDDVRRGNIPDLKLDVMDTLGDLYSWLSPSLYSCTCLQCNMMYTAVIYNDSKGQALTLLPNCDGGITSPHTPTAVSYYLDQAYKAQTMGALSAAATMYRAAIEQILFDQGFTIRMLGPKIEALEKAKTAGNAPGWATDVDERFLVLLKDIGNGAIHSDDIQKQTAIDSELIKVVFSVISLLLQIVYEAPYKKNEFLGSLSFAKQVLK